jgi:hypothetical protein
VLLNAEDLRPLQPAELVDARATSEAWLRLAHLNKASDLFAAIQAYDHSRVATGSWARRMAVQLLAADTVACVFARFGYRAGADWYFTYGLNLIERYPALEQWRARLSAGRAVLRVGVLEAAPVPGDPNEELQCRLISAASTISGSVRDCFADDARCHLGPDGGRVGGDGFCLAPRARWAAAVRCASAGDADMCEGLANIDVAALRQTEVCEAVLLAADSEEPWEVVASLTSELTDLRRLVGPGSCGTLAESLRSLCGVDSTGHGGESKPNN